MLNVDFTKKRISVLIDGIAYNLSKLDLGFGDVRFSCRIMKRTFEFLNERKIAENAPRKSYELIIDSHFGTMIASNKIGDIYSYKTKSIKGDNIKILNQEDKGDDFVSWVDIRVNDKGMARFGKVQTSFIKK